MSAVRFVLAVVAVVGACGVSADVVKESEVEGFKIRSYGFRDEYESDAMRPGDPKIVRTPVSKGLLELSGKGVYVATNRIDIAFSKMHYFTPKNGAEYFAFGARVDEVKGGSAAFVCKSSLGEFTLTLSSRAGGGLGLETRDFGQRPVRLDIPESALPADVVLYGRKDGGFAVTVTSLADNSRRVLTGDAAFFRENFAVGFDVALRLDKTVSTFDRLFIAFAESMLGEGRPRPAVRPIEDFDPEKAGWKQVFSDEFDGAKLDPAKWMVPPWYGFPQAAALDGQGHLAITCDFRPGSTNRLYSTSLWSVPTFRYGYFEAKVKFTRNSGWWSAFWLYGLSNANPTLCGSEIDIFEDYYTRSAKPEDLHLPILDHNLHVFTGKALKSWNYRSELPGTLDDWYRIGCKWTPFEITYYVNGKRMSSRALHSPYESVSFDGLNHAAVAAPLHVLLSGCLNSGWGHCDTRGFKFPERFLIDSVKVWAYPMEESPRVDWVTPQTRSSVRDGEKLVFEADARPSEKKPSPIVRAWLFDNGYPVAVDEKPPWRFEVDHSKAFYDTTRYMGTGRQGVAPKWDALAHFYRVYVQDAAGAVGHTEDYRFRVPAGGTPSVPWRGCRQTVPGEIVLGHFDEGGRGVGHHSFWTTTNRQNKVRLDTAFKCGKKSVAQLKSGEWLNYSIDAKTGGVYRVSLEYASGSDTPNAVELIVDDVSCGRFDCPWPGRINWQELKAKPIEGVRLTSGAHDVRLLIIGYLSVCNLKFELEDADR